jgi:hypothetical protein
MAKHDDSRRDEAARAETERLNGSSWRAAPLASGDRKSCRRSCRTSFCGRFWPSSRGQRRRCSRNCSESGSRHRHPTRCQTTRSRTSCGRSSTAWQRWVCSSSGRTISVTVHCTSGSTAQCCRTRWTSWGPMMELSGTSTFSEAGAREDIRLHLRYYADEDQRREWVKDWPDYELPAHEDPPYDRDSLLPACDW